MGPTRTVWPLRLTCVQDLLLLLLDQGVSPRAKMYLYCLLSQGQIET